MEMNLGARDAVHLFDPQLIQCFDRACSLTDRRPERGEIMLPEQPVGPGLHRVDVQRMIDPPNLSSVMGRGGTTHQDAEQVLPFNRREPRVPIFGHLCHCKNRHGLRLEVIVQRLGQAERIPFLVHVAMGDLTQCMDAGIRPASGCDCVLARLNA